MALLTSVEFIIRIILGIWILGAGLLKLQDLFGFIRIVKETKLFSSSSAPVVGYGYPFIEFLAGLALVLNVMILPALIVVVLKQILSLIGVVILLVQRKKMKNCGCYGTLFPKKLSWYSVIDNVVIILLATILLFA